MQRAIPGISWTVRIGLDNVSSNFNDIDEEDGDIGSADCAHNSENVPSNTQYHILHMPLTSKSPNAEHC